MTVKNQSITSLNHYFVCLSLNPLFNFRYLRQTIDTNSGSGILSKENNFAGPTACHTEGDFDLNYFTGQFHKYFNCTLGIWIPDTSGFQVVNMCGLDRRIETSRPKWYYYRKAGILRLGRKPVGRNDEKAENINLL